jgi:hypothetical protein
MNKFRFFGFLFSKIRTPHQLIAKCFKKVWSIRFTIF